MPILQKKRKKLKKHYVVSGTQSQLLNELNKATKFQLLQRIPQLHTKRGVDTLKFDVMKIELEIYFC